MKAADQKNNRLVPRLDRQPDHSWQLKVNDDELITKNITDISVTGMAFKAPLRSQFKCGQMIKVCFSLNKTEQFECEGKIVWIKRTDDPTGKGQHLGMQLSKIPNHIDALIMKEINDHLMNPRRKAMAEGTGPGPQIVFVRKDKLQSLATSLLGILMGLALSSALIAAIYLHQRHYPEETLAHSLNNAFSRFLATDSKK